jgi:hypothetical protein
VSRGRFGLLLALLALVVAVASFTVALALLDDDAGEVEAGASSTTTTSSSTTVPEGLATPAFVVVVSSEAEEGPAQLLRDELTESGFDAGVLSSADYASLEPGFFVAYVGPFADVASAEGAKADMPWPAGSWCRSPRC